MYLTAHEHELGMVERPGRTVYPFIGPQVARHLTAGVVSFPPGTDAPPHVHGEQEEVLYVLEGNGEIQIDETTVPLRPGDLVFIRPGARHQVRNAGSGPIRLFYAFSPPIAVGTW